MTELSLEKIRMLFTIPRSPKSGERFTINNKTYYPVDEFTGNVLRNEIIVLNSGELAYARKELYTDKDGNIVNDVNEIVADYAFRSSTGTKFYSVTEDGEDESSLQGWRHHN